MGKVLAVCKSVEKGTQKIDVKEAMLIENHGIEGDAHAGEWHRQISLLAFEKIEDFRNQGAEIDFGAFGENIVVEGYDLKKFEIGTKFISGDTILELTQIGKHCHHGCEIFQKMGDCIMPREGVFCRVIQGGMVKAGDEFSVLK